MKSPCLAIIPLPKVKSLLFNHDPQVIQYNIQDLPHLTEEDEEDNEDHSDTEYDEDDSDIEDQESISQDQEQMALPLQPNGMNINPPLPVINTKEHFDIFQMEEPMVIYSMIFDSLLHTHPMHMQLHKSQATQMIALVGV
eukprot:786328-Ditylum_brightwellii.AAC.1